MPVQLGEELVIGFGGNTYAGHILQSSTLEATAETEKYMNEDGDTNTVIIFDRGVSFNFEALIISGSAEIPSQIGSTMTINGVNYRVESSSISREKGAAKLSASIVKEESMAYV